MGEGRIKCCGQAVLRQIAGEYVLVPLGETALKLQNLILLTESSAMLWEKLADGATEQELCASLLDTYEVDPETARADTRKFLENMAQLGLIERA